MSTGLCLDAFFNMVYDLLYMVQSLPAVTLTFCRSAPSHTPSAISTSLLQCYVYLLQHFDVIATNQESIRRSVLSNHFISVFSLLKVNPFVSYHAILSPTSIEQVLVVERLMVKFLHVRFPKPVL